MSAADLETAYGIFRRNGFRRIPVLEGGKAAGMLAVVDLLRDTTQRLIDLLGPISWSTLRDERQGT